MQHDDDDLRWEDVGASEDWAQDSAKRVQIGARKIGVYRVGEQWYALKDVCPHAGVSLCMASSKAGSLCDATVTCPAHGWRFDLASGAMLSGGMGGGSCATYPVRINEGRVLVGV